MENEQKPVEQPEQPLKEAPLDTAADTPNTHNMEPAAPKVKMHKNAFVVLGVVFALIAVGLAALLIIRGGEEVSQTGAQSVDIIASEEVFQDSAGVPVTVETSKIALALIYSDLAVPLAGQELVAKETKLPSQPVQHIGSGSYIYVNEDFGFSLDASSDVPAENETAFQDAVVGTFNSQLHARLESAGFALSPISQQNLEDEVAAVYENPAVRCTFASSPSEPGNVSRVNCHQDSTIEEQYNAIQPLLGSLEGTDFEDATVYASFEEEQAIFGYQFIPGSVSQITVINGAAVGDGIGGGGLDFFKPADSGTWSFFPVGQSIHLCTEYDTDAEQVVYASTECLTNAAAGENTVTTVEDFYQ